MPRFEITAPDGRKFEITAPEGASQDEVLAYAQANYQSIPAPKQSTIGSELVRGGKQVLSSARTGLESIFNPNEAAKAGVARSEDIGKEAGEGVSLEAVKKAYRDKGLLSAAGEAVSQVPRALAGQGANLASMYAGAKAGSTAGAAFGVPGRAIGAALGTGAVLLPQFAGSNVERQAEEQMDAGKNVDINRTKAYSAAAFQAALEGGGTALTLGKRVVGGILGITEDAALKTAAAQAELVKAAERSLATSAGRGAIRGAAEIPVEVAQQILERHQAGLELTSPDAYKEYGESAYQAALIGTPLGGAAGVSGRGQARSQLEQQRRAEEAARPQEPKEPEQAPEEIVPGAKLRQDARVGTQGTLFTRKEMGDKIAEPKETPVPKSAAVQQGEQLGLGLDFQRDYNDLATEREALRAGPRTAEARTRIADLTEQMASYDEATAGQRQAEELIKAEREAKKAKAAVAEPPVVTGITQADVDAIGLPLKTSKQWVQDNVIGKTVEELQALVKREPNLINNKGARAEVLKALIAPQPTAFEEKPNVQTTTKTDQSQGELDLGGGKPSVGVPSEPASTDVVQPGAGVPTTTGTPETPDGLGLAPAGQPAGTRTKAKGTQPAAVTTGEDAPFAMRAANKQEQGFVSSATATLPLPGNAKAIFTQNGDGDIELISPAQGNKVVRAHDARAGSVRSLADFPDYVPVEMRQLMLDYQKSARADYYAKGKLKEKTQQTLSDIQSKIYNASKALQGTKANAPTITSAAPSPAAPATTATEPKTTAKPTATTTTAKETKAPAPAVATETVDEEAARKAEAEDFRRRLEEVERKQKEAPKTQVSQPAKVTPAEKPTAREKAAADTRSAFDFSGPSIYGKDIQAETEVARRGRAATKRAAPNTDVEKSAPWADTYTRPVFNIVFSDDNIGLARSFNDDGSPLYFGVTNTGRYTNTDIDFYTGPLFTPDQKAKLIAERAKAVFEESKKFAKNPDGPFTGAKTNVVKSESVDQRYADYLHDLAQSLGLGSVRFFLVDPADMRKPGSIEKYKLYKDYSTVIPAGMTPGEDGSKRVYGPGNRDFYISFKPGMSENMTLEVISHELGHAIQNIAYDNAPQETKDAIRKEYEEWLETTKGKSGRELVQMLRNRETGATQMMSVVEGKTAAQMHPYWTSFNEWFADNVSRWASTSEKPLSVTEKLFAKVAQMMRDLVAVVTGRKFPPAKTVAKFLDEMGPDNAILWLTGADDVVQPSTKAEFSVNPSTEALIDSMGPLSRDEKSGLKKLIAGVQASPDIDYVTKFRTQVTDIAATIEKRLSNKFDGAVRNSLGELNPMGLYRQAQDYTKMLLEYFQTGTLYKDKATGLWMSGMGEGVRPPAEVYALIDKYGEKNGYSRERATQIASRVLEGVRLNEMRRSNRQDGTSFVIHLKDSDIDQLVKEYNADPDLQEMSKLMDEARKAMVDNMVKVGRLSAEEGKLWREVVGYVPFDRETIDAVASNFNKAKKISGKGLAQLGKLPELVGSLNRPVGNVFNNYLNTLGWMVGQTLKADATLQTLKSLQDIGFAKKLGTNAHGNPNVVGAYVAGEIVYWSVPSKYDVMAFKDLNPPKAGWIRAMGAFSNILRKTVTILPPFALKQVMDDVQRAILTSGVKNPGALVWMSLTNFPKLALAELRGIQHPIVKDFGRLGLTGEYDFEAGKPADSLLKDLGYKKRGRFETIMHRLDGITRASDLAVRKAIYDQTMNESKGDALLAQTRAREFINFRRRGANQFVTDMITVIPFFNAYIQGMDVLYRAASGKDSSASVDRAQARKLFYSRAITVTMLSSLYALGKDDDDEDYNEMDLRTRDSNWILGGGYKIGVPGELGAIFKVIPERIVEYMKRQGTPEEQTAWDATRTTLSYMFEQYLGRAVPVPQAIKPVIEAWANKSFLTGKDLEGYHHKAMDPSMRMTEQTSELAKAIAKFSRDEIGVETSPIMIDNALRGYFGSTAAMVTMVTDSLLNPTRVDRPLHKYALLSNYLYDPVGTRRMTEFYEEREKVGKANTTLNELMKTDLDRAEKYVEEHADELQLENAVNSTLEQLERTRAYRKFLNSPDGAEVMSKDEREVELKELKKMEIDFVGWVREAKTELRKVQR